MIWAQKATVRSSIDGPEVVKYIADTRHELSSINQSFISFQAT